MSSTKIITNWFHPALELNEQRATAIRHRRTHLCYVLQRPCNVCLMSFRAGNLGPRHSVILPTHIWSEKMSIEPFPRIPKKFWKILGSLFMETYIISYSECNSGTIQKPPIWRLYKVTQKNGNFWKTQQKLKKSKKKIYWQKLNHYNLPFKRQ